MDHKFLSQPIVAFGPVITPKSHSGAEQIEPREGQGLVQGHTTMSWQNWVLSQTEKPVLLAQSQGFLSLYVGMSQDGGS